MYPPRWVIWGQIQRPRQKPYCRLSVQQQRPFLPLNVCIGYFAPPNTDKKAFAQHQRVGHLNVLGVVSLHRKGGNAFPLVCTRLDTCPSFGCPDRMTSFKIHGQSFSKTSKLTTFMTRKERPFFFSNTRSDTFRIYLCAPKCA